MVRCTICGQETTDLALHLRTHHGNSYMCLICCQKTYPVHGTLLRHQRDQHGLPRFDREERARRQRESFIYGVQPPGPSHHPPRARNTTTTTAATSSTALIPRPATIPPAALAPSPAINSLATPTLFPPHLQAPTPLPPHLQPPTSRPSPLPPPSQSQSQPSHTGPPPPPQHQQSAFGFSETLIDPVLLRLHDEQQQQRQRQRSTNQASDADHAPEFSYHNRQRR